MRWAELTWPEFERVEKKVAVLPVGVIEAHGPHLPLGTDALMALYVAEKAAEEAGVLLLPPIWYGTTYVLERFPGTISISAETLYRLYKEVFMEVARNGVRYLVVVNGHGGNIDALKMAAKDVAKSTDLTVVLVNWWIDLAKEARRKVLETPEGHAAEDETSEVMAAYPHLVKEVPRDADEWAEAKYAVYGARVYAMIYKKAVQGYPSKASREKGEAILNTPFLLSGRPGGHGAPGRLSAPGAGQRPEGRRPLGLSAFGPFLRASPPCPGRGGGRKQTPWLEFDRYLTLIN